MHGVDIHGNLPDGRTLGDQLASQTLCIRQTLRMRPLQLVAVIGEFQQTVPLIRGIPRDAKAKPG